MDRAQRTLTEFLGPGWVEVEPGIYRPPTLGILDRDGLDADEPAGLAADA
jgi:hypothetical protein